MYLERRVKKNGHTFSVSNDYFVVCFLKSVYCPNLPMDSGHLIVTALCDSSNPINPLYNMRRN